MYSDDYVKREVVAKQIDDLIDKLRTYIDTANEGYSANVPDQLKMFCSGKREAFKEVMDDLVEISRPWKSRYPWAEKLSPISERRLRDGEIAFEQNNPVSREDFEKRIVYLNDGIRALQSLDDLGSAEANNRVWSMIEALFAKRQRWREMWT